MRIAVVGCVLALASVAHAQPGMTPSTLPPPVSMPAPTTPATPSDDAANPNTALALSLGGTIASLGLVVAASASQNDSLSPTLGTLGSLGFMFAPSFGHWYAHEGMTRGLGLRLGGAGGVLLGALVAFAECPLFSSDHCTPGAGLTIMALSGAAYVWGSVDDIVTAPGAARRYNAKRHITYTVAPTVNRGGGGFAVVGAF